MSEIELSKEVKERIVAKVKTYFEDELDQEIGGFEAQFLIDFFAREIGPFFYNEGLHSAQQLFVEKTDEMAYLIAELEKATDYLK